MDMFTVPSRWENLQDLTLKEYMNDRSSVRKILKSVLKEQTINNKCIQTLLCEVESILNDRPLTTSTDDPSDFEAFTSYHLLLMKKQPILPLGLFKKEDSYARRRWKQVQYLADLFWKQWVREYLPLLQEHQKWTKIQKNLAPGDIVMIMDDSAPQGLVGVWKSCSDHF